MIHKNEIIRWANSPDNTKVWQKVSGVGDWSLINYPNWYRADAYIVDDEYAEIRKKYYDDPNLTIEYTSKYSIENWKITYDPKWSLDHKYRIKSSVYEYQWLAWFDDIKTWILTDGFYKDEKTAVNHFDRNGKYIHKLGISKRISQN